MDDKRVQEAKNEICKMGLGGLSNEQEEALKTMVELANDKLSGKLIDKDELMSEDIYKSALTKIVHKASKGYGVGIALDIATKALSHIPAGKEEKVLCFSCEHEASCSPTSRKTECKDYKPLPEKTVPKKTFTDSAPSCVNCGLKETVIEALDQFYSIKQPEKTCLNCGKEECHRISSNGECDLWQPQEVKVIEPISLVKFNKNLTIDGKIEALARTVNEIINHLTQDKK